MGLDVNPSIELVVDSREKVIRAEGINEEGKKILSDMGLRKTDLNVACNAILGKMLKEGYLSDQSNSVLVSVRSDNTKAGRALEDNVSKTINAYLGDTSINGSILGQYVEGDKELEAFAKEHDIYLEISARQGHCLGNGHVANVAREVGNKLLVNTDTHSPDNIITFEKSYEIALGAGLAHDEAMKAIVDNPRELLKSKGIL